ncbi:MAG TPA: CDP-glucose 4,6-dehydratase [Bryobacteraceae bacterium]|nr:CDP-glucose 4,6-dehydratase [Bryobacteraceae bacterium]
MDRAFWRGKRVFLTGHTGFKGGWLSLWLTDMEAHVTGLSLAPPTGPNLYTAAKIGSRVDSIEADIRNPDVLRSSLATARPDIVFHMAAQPLVRRSYREPVETYSTNVLGTVHVLEAVRAFGGARAVINVTSDKAYENREVLWGYRETDAMGGRDPYSSSKGCAELVAAAYRRSYFETGDTRLASVRAGNVIGGGDWAEDRLIPDCMRSLLKGEPIVIRRPQAIRPWQHVLEPLAGYLQYAQGLFEQRDLPPALNFGPREADVQPVGQVVEKLVELWGGHARVELQKDSGPHEAGLLTLDSTLARHKLPWQPRLRLKEALSYTVEWYKRFAAGDQMDTVTLAQIERYESLL